MSTRTPPPTTGRSPILLAVLVLGVVGLILAAFWIVPSLWPDPPKSDDVTFSLIPQLKASEPPPAAPPAPSGKPLAEDRRDGSVSATNWPKGNALDPVPDDGVIVDDTHAIDWFDYLDKQRPIYVTKNFKVMNPLIDPQTQQVRGAQAMQFDGYNFFVKPDLILSQENLDAAFAAKKTAGTQDGKPAFEMVFEARIVDDHLKRYAAAKLNATFPNAKVTPERIQVIPPKGLKLYVWIGDTAVELISPAGANGNVAQTIKIRITGSEELLKSVKDDARLEIRYTVSGYRVKQNISVGMLQYFVRANFHKVMVGDAKYEAISEHGQTLMRAGLDLGIISIGGSSRGIENKYTRNTQVTRNIVRHAATQCNEVIKFHRWMEMPEDKESFDARCKELTDHLLALAKQTEIEVKVADLAKPDQLVAKDVRPDVLGELSGRVKAINNEQRDKKTEVEYAGVKASVDKKKRDENDVEWEEKTGPTGTKIYVPKSIRVYDFSQVDFSRVAQQTVVDSQPEWVTMPVAHEPAVVFRDVPQKLDPAYIEGVDKRIEHWGLKEGRKNDEDLDADGDGYPIEYTFRAEAVTELDNGVKKLAVQVFYRVYEVEDDHTEGQVQKKEFYTLPEKFVHLGHNAQPNEKLLYSLRFHHWGEYKGRIDYDPPGSGTGDLPRRRGKPTIEHLADSPSGTPIHKLLQLQGYGPRENIEIESGFAVELKVPYMRLLEPARYEYRTRVSATEAWKNRPQ